jgi:prepilin signal peptidase PulO-like enzyme (type II secretory pathway)
MIYIVICLFGLALGSFVNALVWRLHEQEAEAEKSQRKNGPSTYVIFLLQKAGQCVRIATTSWLLKI